MATRRQFLVGVGTGAAGLAVGGSVAASTRDGDAWAVALAAAVRRDREDAGRAAAGGGPPQRLGTRRVVWSTTTTEPLAAITFDDGPTPAYTPRVLAALAAAGVRATFYVMGHNAVAHPGLLREVLAAGHELGNHTWSHLDQATSPPRRIREEIVRCTDEVEQIVQVPLVGFRPPRGELTGCALAVCAELGYDTFLWSCTRGPAGISDVATVAGAVGSTVGPGDVLDLHDGLGRGTFRPHAEFARLLAGRREVEVRALPEALRRIADRGVTLTRLTDLLARSAPEPLPTPPAPS